MRLVEEKCKEVGRPLTRADLAADQNGGFVCRRCMHMEQERKQQEAAYKQQLARQAEEERRKAAQRALRLEQERKRKEEKERARQLQIQQEQARLLQQQQLQQQWQRYHGGAATATAGTADGGGRDSQAQAQAAEAMRALQGQGQVQQGKGQYGKMPPSTIPKPPLFSSCGLTDDSARQPSSSSSSSAAPSAAEQTGQGQGQGQQQAPRSRYPGVYWEKRFGAWGAWMSFLGGHTRCLGYFYDEAQAAQSQQLAIVEYKSKGTINGPFPGQLGAQQPQQQQPQQAKPQQQQQQQQQEQGTAQARPSQPQNQQHHQLQQQQGSFYAHAASQPCPFSAGDNAPAPTPAPAPAPPLPTPVPTPSSQGRQPQPPRQEQQQQQQQQQQPPQPKDARRPASSASAASATSSSSGVSYPPRAAYAANYPTVGGYGYGAMYGAHPHAAAAAAAAAAMAQRAYAQQAAQVQRPQPSWLAAAAAATAATATAAGRAAAGAGAGAGGKDRGPAIRYRGVRENPRWDDIKASSGYGKRWEAAWTQPQTGEERSGGFFLTQAEAAWRHDEILSELKERPVNFGGDAKTKDAAMEKELETLRQEVLLAQEGGANATRSGDAGPPSSSSASALAPAPAPASASSSAASSRTPSPAAAPSSAHPTQQPPANGGGGGATTTTARAAATYASYYSSQWYQQYYHSQQYRDYYRQQQLLYQQRQQQQVQQQAQVQQAQAQVKKEGPGAATSHHHQQQPQQQQPQPQQFPQQQQQPQQQLQHVRPAFTATEPKPKKAKVAKAPRQPKQQAPPAPFPAQAPASATTAYASYAARLPPARRRPEQVPFILPDAFPGQKEDIARRERLERQERMRELLARTAAPVALEGPAGGEEVEEKKQPSGGTTKEKEGAEAPAAAATVEMEADPAAMLVCKEEAEAEAEAAPSSSGPATGTVVAKCLHGWDQSGFVPRGVRESLAVGAAWEDPRKCLLCRLPSEDAFLGRLLPFPDKDRGQWVHANCATWSSEVVEADGALYNVFAARSRSKNLKCGACGVGGATVGCNSAGCKANFHFLCALASGCAFFEDRRVFCAAHREEGTRTKKGAECRELPTLDLLATEHLQKVVPPPSTASASASSNSEAPLPEAAATLPPGPALKDGLALRIGALSVHCLGEMVESSPFFHTRRHLFPLGYRASRAFWSAVHPLARTLWACAIDEAPREGGDDGEEAEAGGGRSRAKGRAAAKAAKAADSGGEGEDEDDGDSRGGGAAEDGAFLKPWFRVVALDHPDHVYEGPNLQGVYAELLAAVKKCQGPALEALRTASASAGASGDPAAARPPRRAVIQRGVPAVGARVLSYGLSAYDFLGLANPVVKRYLEGLPGSAVAGLCGVDAQGQESAGAHYRFTYLLPDKVR